LGAVVGEIVGHHKIEDAKLPEICFKNAPEPIVGKWDKSRLEQVIGNLISNAVKYGADRPVDVTIDCDEETKVAHICIQDHGVGIPLEMQKSIFNKFQRIDPVRNISGLGLGLYIVQQIVEAHGGHIYVHSLPQEGSTFIVEIPLGLKEEVTAGAVEAVAGTAH
jgi:signal transduction histidine kinase